MLHFKCSRSARSARSGRGPRLWVPHRMATSAVSVQSASQPRPRTAETAMASEVLASDGTFGNSWGIGALWRYIYIYILSKWIDKVKKVWRKLWTKPWSNIDQLSETFLCQFSEFLFQISSDDRIHGIQCLFQIQFRHAPGPASCTCGNPTAVNFQHLLSAGRVRGSRATAMCKKRLTAAGKSWERWYWYVLVTNIFEKHVVTHISHVISYGRMMWSNRF